MKDKDYDRKKCDGICAWPNTVLNHRLSTLGQGLTETVQKIVKLWKSWPFYWSGLSFTLWQQNIFITIILKQYFTLCQIFEWVFWPWVSPTSKNAHPRAFLVLRAYRPKIANQLKSLKKIELERSFSVNCDVVRDLSRKTAIEKFSTQEWRSISTTFSSR